jgi:carboxypeptidase T
MSKSRLIKSLIVGIVIFFSSISTLSDSKKIESSAVSEKNEDFFYTYDELTDLLTLLQSQYPDIFSFYSLTKTYQSRDMWLVKISDNVIMNESEPQILFIGGVHGNERPGFQAVIYSLKSIVENYTSLKVNESFTLRIRHIVNTTELFFIPMVNPDGITAFTRKNCRPNSCLFGDKKFCGVDLNRNYDYNWEDANRHPLRYIVIPRTWDQLKTLCSGSTTNYLFERTAVKFPLFDFSSIVGLGLYRGPKAFSENESSAVRNFIEKNNVTISVDYHTFGEKIFYPQPWRYTNPTDNSTFISLTENVSKINGYDCSRRINWSNLSGTFPLWAYSTHGIFPLTIELCNSSKQNQKPDEEYLLKVFYTHLLVNLYLAEKTTKMNDKYLL